MKSTSISFSVPSLIGVCALVSFLVPFSNAKLADRGRLVKSRKEQSSVAKVINSRVPGTNTKAIRRDDLPIEGPKYHGRGRQDAYESNLRRQENSQSLVNDLSHGDFDRDLSQLTGCCSTYQSYSASKLCYTYGQNCNYGNTPSHDSGDSSCEMAGLSFIGFSFSVNTANGNPASYQLCDQFPMENLIDREYNYVMSMDEDGWLVGGGYKSFDYSGKMPYIDSSHTELLRIGALDTSRGGTTIAQVYAAMSSISFPPFSVFPEYVKGGGGGHSKDSSSSYSVPSGDITLMVSIVLTYSDNSSYSLYELFLIDLFNAMYAVNSGPCMDDEDTNPHVSMARGVKFKSSYHAEQYLYKVNLEVAVWQAMYPQGVVIGSTTKVNFPPENYRKNLRSVPYGSLYFFFDRANITVPFPPNRNLYDSESYYSTLASTTDLSYYYSSVTSFSFSYAGSGSRNNNQNYEHNPYAWNAGMAMHDMTDGWDLPPNCFMEGETFLGIPLSRASSSKLQSTGTFQNQFDFEYLIDRNFTYMKKFGTNHGWLVGEQLGNAAGSIVDKDTSHIPIFYTGTTNPDMGGISLPNLIKVVSNIDFGTLYIKPAFIFQDSNSGAVKLQFEADPNSALGYLYDNLCKMLGLSWNYQSPSNKYGLYTNCAMHAAGDRASYGCGPGNGNNGGFCPQLTVGYRVNFQSSSHAAAFFQRGNDYIDYWRKLYPNGVAVGTDSFCPKGGCLGLFLNRYDLYQVFKPDQGGSWVEYNGGTFAPTISPAPTMSGGCDNVQNLHLDKCFKRQHPMKAYHFAWQSLGPFGQLSIFLVTFMSVTLSVSIFLARARKKRRKGESYLHFIIRDWKRGHRKGGKNSKKKKSRKMSHKDLEEDLLKRHSSRSKSRSRSKSHARSESKSRSRSESKSHSHGRAESATRIKSISDKHNDPVTILRSSHYGLEYEEPNHPTPRINDESRRSSSSNRALSVPRSSRPRVEENFRYHSSTRMRPEEDELHSSSRFPRQRSSRSSHGSRPSHGRNSVSTNNFEADQNEDEDKPSRRQLV